MSADVKKITRDWIQYLKNNRIVELKSDPDTGHLTYKRKVTTQDVTSFLEAKTDFDNDAISNAIHMVLVQQVQSQGPARIQNKPGSPGTSLSTWNHTEVTPGKKPADRQQYAADVGPKRLANDPDSISDIDYKETPNDGKVPKFKKRTVSEALVDDSGYTLSEDQVEQIFRLLSQSTTASQTDGRTQTSPTKTPQQRSMDLDRLTTLITDRMSNAQRKVLWRLLTNG